MTAGWCSRTFRAAVFAAVCVLLAALGHVMMSGHHVPAWTLAGGAAVSGFVGWCLAGRERGVPLIVFVAVALQTALHSLFSLAPQHEAAGNAPADTGPTHRDMSSMSMDSMDMGHVGMGHTTVSHMDQTAHTMTGSSSFGMLAAHLLAALLCGLWLAYGERAAFRILRAVAGWLAAPLRLLLALPVPPRHPRIRVRRRGDDERSPRWLILTHSITTRGPPTGIAVA
ncbi:hypothetical protein ACFYYD_12620 [Streptomyces bluensis]|uniref:hypothetical protein n=1 Tax=Streptomyces bluensis TaxID=33897 RepID=UPI0036B0BA84